MFWEKTALFSSSSSPPLVCFWSFPAPLSAALPHTLYKPTHKESSCVQIVSLGKMSTLFKKSIWWGLWSTGPPAISSLFILPGCCLKGLFSKLNQINANRVVKGELLASLFHEIFQRTLKMWMIVIFPNKSQICSHFDIFYLWPVCWGVLHILSFVNLENNLKWKVGFFCLWSDLNQVAV